MTSHPAEADPDVLIVGAGPTGAVAAKRFAEGGLRVIVLEQGEWPDYSKARADLDFGVSGRAGDPAFPPEKGPPLPPGPLAPMGRRVAKAHNQLGWHWWPGPNAIATRSYGPLSACTQRATCMWGCVEGAKASVDRTHWPQNIRSGVQLITGARVRRLETNARGLVTGALFLDRNGVDHFQKARVTVLAANGIGTPRILLLSASSKFPNGLANASGLVGRRLMM